MSSLGLPGQLQGPHISSAMTSTKRMVEKTTTFTTFTSNNRARQPKIAARRSAAPAAAAAHLRKEHLRSLVPAFGRGKAGFKERKKNKNILSRLIDETRSDDEE